ncbi:MAG: glycosyltransferase [Nitrospirota bacterium]|nr:glycosyltransferase [Nitrospirota bacterium]
MKSFLIAFLLGFDYFVGFYYGFVNFFYSILLSISFFVVLRHIKRIRYSPIKDFSMSPETPPVSVLIPIYNESNIIIRTLKSALALDYPFFDIIVINDGSTDNTLDTLIKTYKLKKIDLVYRSIIKTARIRGVYYSADTANLLVIDKERSGKADSLNCAINACRNPYFCSVDADSVLEKDSLLRLIAPVMESAVPVVASGGVVRIQNGTEVKNGMIEINLPKNNLAVFQIVEYLRAFLFGRVGWDSINAILILSGTFSLFNKAAVLEIGGYKTNHVSEDMEIIMNLHKHHIEHKKPYRIKFISDPICWTEVPETFKMLGRQRRRWHLGLIQSIFQHKKMMFNPRYGGLGMFVYPYYVFIEMFGPLIEVFGYVVVISTYFLGLLDKEFLLLFLTLAVFYGIFLSTVGVFLEELTYRRYPKWSHLLKLLTYGIFENFGYRQLNSFWRVQAFFQYLFGKRKWEHIEQKGIKNKKG